jgi:hypothetical protein
MSRSGYRDDLDEGVLNLYRGNVERAIKGKRGQAFLKEMAKSLDEMPVKELIVEKLIADDGGCCAIGAVCKSRGLDVSKVDEYDQQEVGELVGIARPLAAEIAYLNDMDDRCSISWSGAMSPDETPGKRWQRMRKWVQDQISA